MDKDKKVRLAAILPESLVNGPGLRRVIFAQGCPHNCEGCFSPHTHSYNEGMLVDMDNIIQEIRKNPMLRGVTFSGGDPWEQADEFAYLAREIKKIGLNIWCYTGYTFEYILQNQNNRKGWAELLESIDVLVDGKFEASKANSNLRFRGSSNQRIIDVKGSIEVFQAVALDIEAP